MLSLVAALEVAAGMAARTEAVEVVIAVRAVMGAAVHTGFAVGLAALDRLPAGETLTRDAL